MKYNNKTIHKLLLLTILSIIITSNPVIAQDDWELKKNKDGIRVFTSEIPNNKIDAFKAEIELNVSAEKLLNLLTDFDNGCKITYKCEESKAIKPFANDRAVYYQKIKTPWPADDRDMVCDFRVEREVDGKIYIHVVPSKIEYEKEDKVVRMIKFKDDRVIIPVAPNKCAYIVEGYFDPGGTLPEWVTNLFLTDGPLYSLQKIREELE